MKIRNIVFVDCGCFVHNK